MSSLINPLTTVITFAFVLIVLGLVKPQVSRVILGIFFLTMGLGVNLAVLLSDPNLYVAAGSHALLPVYRWFFTQVLAWNPVVFVIPLILFETAVGALILSKGRGVQLGLVGGILFLIFVTPVGVEELTAPALALALGVLLPRRFVRSLPEIVFA